jgi:ATP-dependent Clp protease ATP-binding subunit ClpA
VVNVGGSSSWRQGGRVGGLTGRVVGRDAELGRMESLLNRALAGNGGLVACTGEAGIGKTRLAEELGSASKFAG